MADLIDLAQQQQERLQTAREKYGRGLAPAPEATGFCLNCGNPLTDGRRWCDAECRDDSDRRDRRDRRRQDEGE
jgi:hypothetical protein